MQNSSDHAEVGEEIKAAKAAEQIRADVRRHQEQIDQKYPEHVKLRAVVRESQAIGEFIEWLTTQGITLFKFDAETSRYWPQDKSIQTLLAEHFEIDERKLEQEKRTMLAELREGGKVY